MYTQALIGFAPSRVRDVPMAAVLQGVRKGEV
jgi:hypothetical protein